ncbi:sugar ABC transporter sugar-binding protein [Leifsonia xyli subsp. cynodontis DSM 46306]|jgi:raffinose/stachyose/melibiose transport system substrate-binding protein|uniref:Extracellular solute-binding protein n=2 Tax=Leifsonia xyli TaxID=1575 RepID=U3P3P1_LEIXC|nr:sugar ABC transporter sugar-binding protein [Leifsonia xyli subsp. cynodontis DSM 46306]
MLAVWSWRPEDKGAYTKIFAEYEKRHPGVTVKVSAFKKTEYPQVLTTGLTGSNGPDIAQVQAYGKLQPYVDGGNLVAFDGAIPGLKDIDEAALAGATGKKDGKVYGVPFAMQTLQMFYNKDIFAKHKLSVPTTWDDFLRVNATLKQNGITPMAVGGKDTWTLPILHDTLAAAVYGGSAFQKEVVAGATTFEDPVYVKSIQTVASVQGDTPIAPWSPSSSCSPAAPSSTPGTRLPTTSSAAPSPSCTPGSRRCATASGRTPPPWPPSAASSP